MTSTLYLIVARGGSKGVPGKNLKKIGGTTLVGWKARAARECDPNCRLVISTESEEIAMEAREHGVDVPFKRPDELATDTASSASVILHALETLAANGENFERVMLLEPSSPFTTAHTLKYAGICMDSLFGDLVVGMREVQPHTAFISEVPRNSSINPIIESMKKYGQNLRRQDLQPEWTMNGALYLFKTEMFLQTEDIYGGKNSHGILMPRWEGIEIDHPEDLVLAEFAYEKGLHDGRSPRADAA